MPGGISGKDTLGILAAKWQARDEADAAWRDAIIEAYLDQHSIREIAEYAGISHEGVRLIIRKAGL